jgi:uncharacterized protein (DUF2249 family)
MEYPGGRGAAEKRLKLSMQRNPMVAISEEHPLVKTWQDGHAFHLDVRELLENGGEPYFHIMDCLHQLGSGESLVVHALFEPKPLIKQVERLGYLAAPQRESAEHWTVKIEKKD